MSRVDVQAGADSTWASEDVTCHRTLDEQPAGLLATTGAPGSSSSSRLAGDNEDNEIDIEDDEAFDEEPEDFDDEDDDERDGDDGDDFLPDDDFDYEEDDADYGGFEDGHGRAYDRAGRGYDVDYEDDYEEY